jgi:Tol biopolymer transport system component
MRRPGRPKLLGLVPSLVCLVLALLVPIASATFPGANGRIAFDTNRRTTTINTILPDGTGQQAVIRGTGPAWSPNGRRLAFVHGGSIFTARADGTDERLIAPGGRLWSPSYSPSGHRVAYYDLNTDVISTVRTDGTGAVQIAHGFNAIYSPVRREIVYNRDSPHHGIWIMRSDGSHKRQLTRLGAAFDFSPNGRRIIVSGRGGVAAYSVPVYGGAIHRLGPCAGFDASFSPDGTKLLSTHVHGAGSNIRITLDVTPADGSCPATTILSTHHSLFAPAWQPLPNG